MALDPSKFRVESHHAPMWEQTESFQDVMADQLRRTPWLLLSVAIHGIAIFLIALIPADTSVKKDEFVQMQRPDDEQKVEEEEKPEEKPEEEKPVEEPVMQDQEVTENVTEVSENFDADVVAESAFDNNSWNTAVGLGGGAGGKFGGRGGGRKALGTKGGRDTAIAIEMGLEWLKKHQDPDGKWDADDFMKHDIEAEGPPCDGPGNAVHDIGLTGLALLAFLGDGSTLRSGPYKDQIKAGIKWLREQQDEASGMFGTNTSHDFIYDHSIATLAMVEAFGLSDSKLLRRPAQKALNYLESHRNPYSVWRYQPRDNENDSSVTAWCLQAYSSAKFFKLDVNDQAMKLCEVWFDSVTDPITGKAGYTKRNEPSSRHPGDHGARFPVEKGEAMTAVGLLCRYFLDQDVKSHPVMTQAADTVLKKPPVWDTKAGTIDEYYWYYATYGLYMMGGRHWDTWQKALTPAVVKTQRKDANFKGSWDPVGAWGDDGGRVYSTAILVLTLEAYYRYVRIVH